MLTKSHIQRPLTKGEIRDIALKILAYRNCKVWKQNNIAVKGRKFIGERGVADILGHHRKIGVMVGAEIKTVNDKLSEEQKTWLFELEQSGGIALIAHEVHSQVVLTPYGEYCLSQLKK